MWEQFLESQTLPQQRQQQQQEEEEARQEEDGGEAACPSPAPAVAAAAASLHAFTAVLKARAGGSATTPAAPAASRGELRGGG